MDYRYTFDPAAAREFLLGQGRQLIALVTERVVSLAEQAAPVDTGYLKSTIGASYGSDGLSSVVYVRAPYSVYVEFGHLTRSGSWVPPNPFFRNAIAQAMAEIGSGLGASVASTAFAGSANAFTF